MKRLTTLFLVFSSFFAVAQNKATVTANSDFKTIHNGFVESTFVFNQNLAPQQIASFTEWTNDNKPVGNFSLAGETLTTSIHVESNQRGVYEKMFYLLGVDVLEVVVNGQKKAMDKDDFFAHFNL